LSGEAMELEEVTTVKEYPTSFLFQLKIIVGRTFKAFWRLPDYECTRLVSQ
jgi:hypothetical protein